MAARGVEREVTSCTATHTLDYDSLSCDLRAGHSGPHQDKHNEDGAVWWQKNDLRKRNDG